MMTEEMTSALTEASAVWGEWQGVRVPSHFGDPDREVAALAAGWGVTDLSSLGLIALHGPDAEGYLSRQLTNRVKGLGPGEGCRAAALRGDGTMVGEMVLHRLGEADFLCVTPPSCADALAAHFERYIFTEKITIERWNDTCGLVSVHGGEVAHHLAETLGRDAIVLSHGASHGMAINGVDLTALDSALFGVPGIHLMGSPDSMPDLWDRLIRAGAVPVGIDALTVARIERGVPLFGEDHDHTWIPNDAGLDEMIDYQKGCFPGQEVVAKIHNIGHPRRALRGFLVTAKSEPARGTAVFGEGGEIGALASVCQSPRFEGFIALGHLKWRSSDTGQSVKLGDRDGSAGSAVVVDLPFEERS